MQRSARHLACVLHMPADLGPTSAQPMPACSAAQLSSRHRCSTHPSDPSSDLFKDCILTSACRDTFQDAASDPITHSELAALFAVIGTPAWADVERVQSQAWRHYLHQLPGRAPTLVRQFGYAGGLLLSLPAGDGSFAGGWTGWEVAVCAG